MSEKSEAREKIDYLIYEGITAMAHPPPKEACEHMTLMVRRILFNIDQLPHIRAYLAEIDPQPWLKAEEVSEPGWYWVDRERWRFMPRELGWHEGRLHLLDEVGEIGLAIDSQFVMSAKFQPVKPPGGER